MIFIDGRKYACDACIRGHRASTCNHTQRQLQAVRPKGRPSSQCDLCRVKRATGSFHGRCECGNESHSPSSKNEEPFAGATTTAATTTRLSDAFNDEYGSLGGTQASSSSSSNRHSLQSLMNPCQCRTTGICTCCKKSPTARQQGQGGDGLPTDARQATGNISSCCDESQCCSDALSACTPAAKGPECAQKTECGSNEAAKKGGCCSSKAKVPSTTTTSIPESSSTPSSSKLAATAPFPARSGNGDVHEEMLTALGTSSECQCGPTCSCPGCEGNMHPESEADVDDDCPVKCGTCVPCAFGLTRPSGIDVVDEWMANGDPSSKGGVLKPEQTQQEAQGQSRKRQKRGQTASGPLTSLAIEKEGQQQQQQQKPLSEASFTFERADAFHKSHFLDPAKREHFLTQMSAMKPYVNQSTLMQSADYQQQMNSEQDMRYGDSLPGESDEDWQARHGFSHLTPASVRIFDHARQFREAKKRAMEEEETARVTREQELAQLRARALAGRKSAAA